MAHERQRVALPEERRHLRIRGQALQFGIFSETAEARPERPQGRLSKSTLLVVALSGLENLYIFAVLL